MQGYLKLVDFGTAKKLEAKCGRTFTLVGNAPRFFASRIPKDSGFAAASGRMLLVSVCGVKTAH